MEQTKQTNPNPQSNGIVNLNGKLDFPFLNWVKKNAKSTILV